MRPNYLLKLQWLRFKHGANSGVLLRSPDPRTTRDQEGKLYRNTACVADRFGYEVQIDELARPHGLGKHRTGAIYGVNGQSLSPQPANPAREWNDYEIRVEDNRFTVKLNGVQVTDFLNADPNRGQPTTAAAPSYIGLQIHYESRMAFRNLEFQEI